MLPKTNKINKLTTQRVYLNRVNRKGCCKIGWGGGGIITEEIGAGTFHQLLMKSSSSFQDDGKSV